MTTTIITVSIIGGIALGVIAAIYLIRKAVEYAVGRGLGW